MSIFCENPRFLINPQLSQISKYASLAVYYGSKRFSELAMPPSPSEDNVDLFKVVNLDTGETYPYYYEVPCGHCLLCADRKRSSLSRRLNYEFNTTTCVPLFLTLTFDEDNYHHIALKTDIQDYIKRVREYYYKQNGKRLNMRYFAVSEHGKRTNRLHYHVILFDFPQHGVDDCIKYIQERWPYGHVHVEFIQKNGNYKKRNKSYKSVFNYVSKYVCKDTGNAEICLYSKGLGSEYLINNFRSYCNANPTAKDLVYYDYSSNKFRPMVIDKTFIYYVFWKSQYYNYIKAFREIRDNGTAYHRSLLQHDVEVGELLPAYAPYPCLNTKTPISDERFYELYDTLIAYQRLQIRSSIFCIANQDKKTPELTKQLRALRLAQIKENIEHMIDKEKI